MRGWQCADQSPKSKEMGCRPSAPRVYGFQTCRSFMTLALNSHTDPSDVHGSRTSGEVSILSADTCSTFGDREEEFPRVCERTKMFYSRDRANVSLIIIIVDFWLKYVRDVLP